MANIKSLSSTLLLLTATTTSVLAIEGPYFSGAITNSQAQNMPDLPSTPADPTANYTYTTKESNHTLGYSLAAGYFKDLHPDFGLGGEVSYNTYGNKEYSTTYNNMNSKLTYYFSSIDFLAKPTWHIDSMWDLYGKLGAAYEHVSLSGDKSSILGSDVSNNSKLLPEVGLGTSVFATRNLSVDLNVNYIRGKDIELNASSGNNLPSIFSTELGVSYYIS